jgi:hypothetical protein
MSRSDGKKKFINIVDALPQASIMEHCRTVVEKKDFVSTGIMSFAEGDMLEVEISDFDRFVLGESVKLTVYTPVGIYLIPSTIVGKDTGSLMMINPPENQRKFQDKRQYPRVEVAKSGHLASVLNSGGRNSLVLPKPVPFQIRNISLSGIGFTMPEEVKLDPSSNVEMEIDVGTIIPCTAEIVRTEMAEEGVYYGARYIQVAGDKLNSLRAFILREQIAAHSITKRDSNRKRMFK